MHWCSMHIYLGLLYALDGSGEFNQHEVAGLLNLLSLYFVWSLVSYSKQLYLLLDAICSEHMFLSFHMKVISGFYSEVQFL